MWVVAHAVVLVMVRVVVVMVMVVMVAAVVQLWGLPAHQPRVHEALSGVRAEHPVDSEAPGLRVDEGLLLLMLLPLTDADVRSGGASPTSRVRLMCSQMWRPVVQSGARVEVLPVSLHVLRLGAGGPRGASLGCSHRSCGRCGCRVRQRCHPLVSVAQHVATVAPHHGTLHEVTLHHLDRRVSSVTRRHRGDSWAARLHAAASPV